MRIESWWPLALTLLMAGCVTTHSDSNPLGQHMPSVSKGEQASEAARIHTELGRRYMEAGDLQSALEKLTKAVQFDPKYAPAHTVLAVLYERINRPVDAEQEYRKAVALEPARGGPNNNLGVFLCQSGQAAEAEGFFRKAVADPFYATPDVALTNAGVCQLRAGHLAAAEAAFRDALTRNPDNAEALLQMADALYRGGDAFRARAFIQRFDAQDKPTAASLKLGLDIESRLGNRDGAYQYRQRLQRQFPDSEQARALDTTASQ